MHCVVYVQTNLGLLFYVDMLFGLAYILPLWRACIPFSNLHKGYLHIRFHSYNQGIPRLVIQFVLWCHFVIHGRWVLVLPWTVIGWPPTNPYKMGDWLWHRVHWTSYICYKWWKDMASLGCIMPWYKCYVAGDTNCICHMVKLVKVECKRKSINPFYFCWYEFCRFGFI